MDPRRLGRWGALVAAAALVGAVALLATGHEGRSGTVSGVGRDDVRSLELVVLGGPPRCHRSDGDPGPGTCPSPHAGRVYLNPAVPGPSPERDAIPIPLPAPLAQPERCTRRQLVVVHLRDGRSFRYGPCAFPAGMEALRTTLDWMLLPV